MRIVALNVAHQAKEAEFSLALVRAIRALAPDLLVLNEYVDSASQAPLRSALHSLGLLHVVVSEPNNALARTRNNQILIASKQSIRQGGLHGPDTHDGAGSANFLHVVLDQLSLEFVGLRVPIWDDMPASVSHSYWRQLCAIVQSCATRRVVFIGDFNANPEKHSDMGAQYLSELRGGGWMIPAAEGPWSYYTGSRIDHALLAPGLTGSAEYLAQINGEVVASGDRKARVSDHAAVVLDLKLPALDVEMKRQPLSSLKFTEAFAKYGATLKNRYWSVCAEAPDGSLVVSVWRHLLTEKDGTSIYRDRFERWRWHGKTELRRKLQRASDTGQPLRAVVAHTDSPDKIAAGVDASTVRKWYSVEEDWIGRVTHVDGEEFEIEFMPVKDVAK